MRTALLLLIAAAASAGERAFVETVTARDTYYVNEPIVLRLRVAIESGFLKSNVVQMFQNRLDFPVQVRAAWLKELDGTVMRKHGGSGGVTFALNGAVASARETARDGYTVLEIERTVLPTRAGKLVIGAPRVGFAWGTEFVDDFIHGRTAKDRKDETVEGKAVTLEVLPLPEAQPDGFQGAVGRLTVRAETSTRRIRARATFPLTLRIEGEGNLESFEAPRFDGLEDFHVYGMLDEKKTTRRTVTYQLAALHAGVKEIPVIPFTYFDTREKKFRTIGTEPIAITVTGEPPPGMPTTKEAEVPEGGSPWFVVGPLLAVALAALIFLRTRPEPETPDAAAEFGARAEQDLAAAFTDYLAARMGCESAAVISPDLAQRLKASGVPADLAGRCAAMVEGLVAARYGGDARDDRKAAGALVEEIERL